MAKWWCKMLGLAILPTVVYSFAATDMPQDADPPQSGYLPNHNIDPVRVAANLTIAWKKTFNVNEVFYAKPLVYTPAGAPNEYVITVSNQNIVRVMDGITGNLIQSRTLDAPFASSDTDCGDIPNTVGITGTPIIDTATDIMYFFAKGYKNGQAGPQGTILGQYKFYAVQLPSLADTTGFPIIIDGNFANNDPTRYFLGGTVLNRPGLAMIGNTIVGGFGGHCDNFNYTGMLVAVSKTPGVGVTNIQAMEASPGAPSPQELDITQQGGGKAGIWQSGMGIAADTSANRVFFVTGNARGAGQNGGASGKPASGKVYLSTLEQCTVNMGVNPSTGALTQQDYFEPYAYDSDNGGDLDFGSAGVALLDPTVFNGTGVSRIAVAGGKDGKVYIMNANNLGGFAGGSAGADFVIQTIVDANRLLSGPASYPLEGGYIYLQPNADFLYAYSFSQDGNGNPVFTLAGKSAKTFAGQSVPTVTSLNGQPGTGIVWLADGNWGLTAYNAVPVNGVLTPITLPTSAATGGINKYQRVVFGDARIYTTKASALIMLSGGGQTQSAPVTCSPNPIAFGSVTVANTETIQVTCTANTAITNPSCNTSSAIYQCGSSTIPSTVASGGSFTFPVTFNLSDANILQYQEATSKQVVPGTLAASLQVYASAGSAYLPDIVVQLSGTVVAPGGYLTINQISVSFGGVYIGGEQPSQASSSITLTNDGSSTLTFQGFAWQDYYVSGMPYNNVTSSVVGNGYTSPNFPAVGSTLAAGASLNIPLVFLPNSLGISASYLTFWSDGGYTELLMQGTAAQGSAPPPSPSSSTTITSTTSSSTSSSSVATTSSISSSSSSISSSSSVSTSSSSSASTSSSSSVSTSSSSSVSTSSSSSSISSSSSVPTSSSSSVSTSSSSSSISSSSSVSTSSSSSVSTSSSSSSITSSSQSSSLSSSTTSSVSSSTTVVAPTGPSNLATIGTYSYVGCYTEATTGRALSAIEYYNNSLTVEMCYAVCAGYTWFGVEYHRECYCGNTPAAGSILTTSGCSDTCMGNPNEYCGGANRLSMYNNINPVSVSSSSSSTPSPSSSSSSSIPVTSSSSVSSTSTAGSSSSSSSIPVTSSSSSSLSSAAGSSSSSSNIPVTSSSSSSLSSAAGSSSSSSSIPVTSSSSISLSSAAGSSSSSSSISVTSSSSVSSSSTAGSSSSSSSISVTSSSSSSSSSTAGSSSSSSSITSSTTTTSTLSSSISSTSSSSSSSSTSSTTSSSSSSVFTTLSTSTTSTLISTSSTSTSALPYVTPPAPIRRNYAWSIGWVEAAPDGYSRPFVGINGQWPCPAVSANLGDTIIITLTNNLVNESTALHFHGIHQINTTYADGPAMVTQCPIQPGGVFVYEFVVNQSGTYWYHAHIGGQYIDGFRGPLIFTDVNAPYRVHQEYTLTLSDLYHYQAPGLINYYQSVANAENNNGGEPVPNSILINEAQNVTFTITPGQTYLFHIINMGAFAPQYLQFDQHEMTVVEIDGVYTTPTTVSQLFVTVAQRYGVIITAKTTNTQNFAIKASMSTTMFNPTLIPATFNTEVSAFLVYNAALSLPAPLTITPAPFDDSIFTPYDQKAEFGPVGTSLQMTVDFGTNVNGQYRGLINGIDYVQQQVPTLYTAMAAPAADVNNPVIYGTNSNPFVLPYLSVVELTVDNHDQFSHPFHLHGHNFQVVSRDSGGALFPINPPAGPPMRRDTVLIMAGGSATIRFVADNPGINLFHCHIEWHVEAGLTATFIEAPTQLQALNLYIPVSHRDVCTNQSIARKGNAAGNTANYLNLAGANDVAPTSMWGSLVNPPTTPAPPYNLS